MEKCISFNKTIISTGSRSTLNRENGEHMNFYYVVFDGKVITENEINKYKSDEIEFLGFYNNKKDAIKNSVFDLH